ncbi:CPLD24 [Auxenochlorella protothecoides x Auxenochlorella symbiontica]
MHRTLLPTPAQFTSLWGRTAPALFCTHPQNQLSARSRQDRRTSRAFMGKKADAPAQAITIIGGGRIGQALVDMGPGSDVLLKRGSSFPKDAPSPIIVCTRNDALEGVIESVPKDRHGDLVFIQNGMLQPWLEGRGLASATQLLVYFAVAKAGDTPVDGKTDVNPEGLTSVWGPHSEAVAQRLAAGGLACKVLDRPAFLQAMLEKLVWISAFMLVGVTHGGCSVGEVERVHSQQTAELVEELASAGAAALGVRLEAGAWERLAAYARSVANYPTALKEFEWRNGWFKELSREASASGKQDPCPMHTRLLAGLGY